LLDRLTGGVAVRESLNVEFAAVSERRADLLFLLEDDSIFHLDFQSENDRDMAYREGIYGLMAGQKYRRRIRQTVLYTGPARMHMRDRLDLGEIQVSYRLVDIRDFDAEAFLQSGQPGDCALALLARGGTGHLREILETAGRLPGPQREKVLGQLVALSGFAPVGWEGDNGVEEYGLRKVRGRSCVSPGNPGHRAGGRKGKRKG
jgi:hypothetical protein